jgi:hypothetical protein
MPAEIGNPMVIRHALSGDLPQLLALYPHLNRADPTRRLKSPNARRPQPLCLSCYLATSFRLAQAPGRRHTLQAGRP